MWKNKPFPHYWNLYVIFGKDQAPRKDLQTLANVVKINAEGGYGDTMKVMDYSFGERDSTAN